jgi:hypothetical protein
MNTWRESFKLNVTTTRQQSAFLLIGSQKNQSSPLPEIAILTSDGVLARVDRPPTGVAHSAIDSHNPRRNQARRCSLCDTRGIQSPCTSTPVERIAIGHQFVAQLFAVSGRSQLNLSPSFRYVR